MVCGGRGGPGGRGGFFGGFPGEVNNGWRAKGLDSFDCEYGFSCMGYEIAGGLGVKMARPEGEVYVLVGDGSYLMMSSDLVTALQEGLKLTVLLLDNEVVEAPGRPDLLGGEVRPDRPGQLADVPAAGRGVDVQIEDLSPAEDACNSFRAKAFKLLGGVEPRGGIRRREP